MIRAHNAIERHRVVSPAKPQPQPATMDGERPIQGDHEEESVAIIAAECSCSPHAAATRSDDASDDARGHDAADTDERCRGGRREREGVQARPPSPDRRRRNDGIELDEDA